jgi:hypothetical protein
MGMCPEYIFRAVMLMNDLGDTKAGTLIATDRYGNKYFENLAEELPCKLAIAHLSTVPILTDQKCGHDG